MLKRRLLSSGLSAITLLTLFAPNSRAEEYSAACVSTISQADQLYLEGDTTAAEQLYRQCKSAGSSTVTTYFPEPITDITQLEPNEQSNWQQAQTSLSRNRQERALVFLKNLLERSPEFVPAYSLLAEALQDTEASDEALAVLEQASTLFPHDADIANARISALRSVDQPLEASIAARLFAMVNPDHPEVNGFQKSAQKDLERFKSSVRSQYLAQTGLGIVGNILLGGGSVLENALNPQTLQAVQMVVEGESKMGSRFAAQYVSDAKSSDKLFEDPVVVDYVTRIGEDVAELMGRDEFEYEFWVIEDPSINAFALPGGKVFVHTGAILAANSESELAGLIGHEVAHAVLSHGYQRMSQASLLAAANNVIPAGGNLLGLVALSGSRQNERQSDILGTRAVAGAGYAADGLHNFFRTLNEQGGQSPPEYLSTHPATTTRLSYLDALIDENGYNRFAYEGIARHREIQQRVRETLGN
ncbi:peptidase, M48 family [Synechococcus sp. PCC 7335]|uniref:M48 family metalloprotease n=1 Tax=Synechococcus sp. (strain ATCC 29403 / PCC 7335) TaxID=91464 RepID=UPI00017EE38B|nr:M48 family metalloprotease [Synechococcus sp. PCC 7335]EDX85715.1 peptidase, M48 family [Synechococcus sp. PCC 7335]